MSKRHLLQTIVIASCSLAAWANVLRAEPSVAPADLAPRVVIAGRILTPDGSFRHDAAMTIANGLIESVDDAGRNSAEEDAPRYPNAVICPGLIDLRSGFGAHGQVRESFSALDPAASAVDAFDPSHRDFRKALAAGITTAVITPSASNLITGAATVVKCAGAGRRIRILRDDGPLTIALTQSVYEPDRTPTSRLGAGAMLRETLASARKGTGHPRVQAFVRGELDAFVICDEAMDVLGAIEMLGECGRRLNLFYTGDAHDLAELFVADNRAVVVGPLSYDMDPRTLAAPGAFANAGVAVAFAGSAPSQPLESLRMTAALAVRYGMDPADARRALATTPAIVAGVGHRVGALQPGLDADFIIFSDDPLRMDARVLEVYVDGNRVFCAESPTDSSFSGADQ